MENQLQFPQLEFTQISSYIQRSQSYYQNMIYRLYFLNKSNSNFNFILRNNFEFNGNLLAENNLTLMKEIKFNENFLVKIDPSYNNETDYNFDFISDILINSPSSFENLVLIFNNNSLVEDYIANVYFPSQFAFFFCSFFQEKAKDFILNYLNECTNSKFVLRIAGSFISSSNKFRESLLTTFIQNKAKNQIESTDDHILIQSFFELLHLLTIQQYQVFNEIVSKSKENATEMILKFVLSPAVRSWEFSDFFVGTDILYSSYNMKGSNSDETNRCELLQMLENPDNSKNSKFFDDLYSQFINDNTTPHQETIDLEKLINQNKIKFANTTIEFKFNKILKKIHDSNGSPSEQDIQRMAGSFIDILKDLKYLFKFNLYGKEIKISSSEILNRQYKCPKELEDDFFFFQKIKAQASETLQDFPEFYEKSLKDSLGIDSVSPLTFLNPEYNLNQIKKRAFDAYNGEIKFAQDQRMINGQRVRKARLLKDEIRSAENLINDIVLKLVFKYDNYFVGPLMEVTSKCDQDVDVLTHITEDTTKLISVCIKYSDDEAELTKLQDCVKDFLVNCKNPDEFLSFLSTRKELYQKYSSQTYSNYLFSNKIMMILTFERAKLVYIFSNRKFYSIHNPKLKDDNTQIEAEINSLAGALEIFKSFDSIGVLLGSNIAISQSHLRGLHMIHIMRLMNIILQICYSLRLNYNNSQNYFDASDINAVDPELKLIPFYLFFCFVNPTFELKNEANQKYILNVFQIFFSVCELINTFIMSSQDQFKFVDKSIINIIKNSKKNILDNSDQEQFKEQQNEDISDFEYMKYYSENLMEINNKLIDNFIY